MAKCLRCGAELTGPVCKCGFDISAGVNLLGAMEEREALSYGPLSGAVLGEMTKRWKAEVVADKELAEKMVGVCQSIHLALENRKSDEIKKAAVAQYAESIIAETGLTEETFDMELIPLLCEREYLLKLRDQEKTLGELINMTDSWIHSLTERIDAVIASNEQIEILEKYIANGVDISQAEKAVRAVDSKLSTLNAENIGRWEQIMDKLAPLKALLPEAARDELFKCWELRRTL